MRHKAWCNVEQVPYNFSRLSIKFQGHMGWKIDDFNPIWVRLLGRSQLSNPSYLPCFAQIRQSWFSVTLSVKEHPDSKVHVANMGPTWVLWAPGGSHAGPMNLAIWFMKKKRQYQTTTKHNKAMCIIQGMYKYKQLWGWHVYFDILVDKFAH